MSAQIYRLPTRIRSVRIDPAPVYTKADIERALQRGFWTAAALYTVGSLVLVGALHALGVHA